MLNLMSALAIQAAKQPEGNWERALDATAKERLRAKWARKRSR